MHLLHAQAPKPRKPSQPGARKRKSLDGQPSRAAQPGETMPEEEEEQDEDGPESPPKRRRIKPRAAIPGEWSCM